MNKSKVPEHLMDKIEVTLKREGYVKKIYFDDLNSAQIFCEQYEDENPPFDGAIRYCLSITSMKVKNALRRFLRKLSPDEIRQLEVAERE